MTVTQSEVQSAYDTESANIPRYGERISGLCKFAWAGSLAIFFGLATAKSDSGTSVLLTGQRTLLFAAATAGALAFIFDYLQNVSAYVHTRQFLTWIESTTSFSKEALNDRSVSAFSRCARFAFFLKNVFALLAALLVGLAIIRGYFG